MAIANFVPNEAAAIVLKYTLSDYLTQGQIEQLSHEILLDKISEEYPEIGLHKTLFMVNQLLYKAYNAKFLNTKSTIVTFEITPIANAETTITKEIVVKCFAKNLTKHNVMKRLFDNQLHAIEAFEEANDVLWDLKKNNTLYQFTTSDYWMSRDAFLYEAFTCDIAFFKEETN